MKRRIITAVLALCVVCAVLGLCRRPAWTLETEPTQAPEPTGMEAPAPEEPSELDAEPTEEIAPLAEADTGTEPETPTSGTCGDGLTWTLDSYGTLTISGTGAMEDFGGTSRAPWYNWSTNIRRAVIEPGVTSIGNQAFASCYYLCNVSIPESVIAIGKGAFISCSLTDITIPSTLNSIGNGAFAYSGLTTVKYGGTAAQWNAATNGAAGIFDEIANPVKIHVEKDLNVARQGMRLTDDPELFQAIYSFRAPVKENLDDCKGYLKQCVEGITEDDITVTVETTDGDLSVLTFTFKSPKDGTFDIDLEPFLLVENTNDANSVFAYDIAQTHTPIVVVAAPTPEPTVTPEPTLPPVTPPPTTEPSSPPLHSYPVYPLYPSDPPVTPPPVDPITPVEPNPDPEPGPEVTEQPSPQPIVSPNPGPVPTYWPTPTPTPRPTASPEPSAEPTDAPASQFPEASASDGPVEPTSELPPDPPVNSTPPTQPVPPPVVDPDPTPAPPPVVDPNPQPTPMEGTPGLSDDPADDPMAGHEDEILIPESAPTAPPDWAPIRSIVQETVRTERYPILWQERITPPDYALDLYDLLIWGSKRESDRKTETGSSTGARPGGEDELPIFSKEVPEFLVDDSYFEVDPAAPGGRGNFRVPEAEEVTFAMTDAYAGGASSIKVLDSVVFEDESFNQVDVSQSDKRINYTSLQLGDVVRTSTFNGVFVVSTPKGADFDAKKKEISAYVAAVLHAFDRDHPEVFWLSSKCRLKAFTVNNSSGGQTVYFFMVLAGDDGFTMRAPAWTAPGAVTAGIVRRDKAIEKILATVTAQNAAGQIKQLNRWLTEHNEYNTSPDLSAIGNEPHESLAALEGRTGVNGPVCDGYARAFKVLCDQLEIPCVLEDGYAKTNPTAAGVFHMWNLVKIGPDWYGVDITWNDPTVKGVSGAVSGRENEQFLLVGSDTVLLGMAFSESHPVINQAAIGGVQFTNSPALCTVAYTEPTELETVILPDSDRVVPSPVPGSSGSAQNPFLDVPAGYWAEQPILWAYGHGYVTGSAAGTFGPGDTCTRAQAVTILWRAADYPLPKVRNNPFSDIPDDAYYRDAVLWAVENGITNGTSADTFTPGRMVNWGEILSFLYREKGSPTVGHTFRFTNVADGAYYADAAQWAASENVISGVSSAMFDPMRKCSRAHLVAFMYNARYAEG